MAATRWRRLPLGKVYGLLEPGPVLLLTTARRGRANVMPMSWHTVLEFEPPQLGCVVSRANHSHAALKSTRECVLNIPTVELAEAVVRCGNSSGRDLDKFAAFGLTPLPAPPLAAPRIAQCWAGLACRVVDTRMVNRYDFFVLEVVAAWVDTTRKDPRTLHHRGWGKFGVMGETIRLASKMR